MKRRLPGKTLLFSGALIFFTHLSSAQYLFDDQCQQAYRSIISLEFNEARRLLESEQHQNPKNLIPVYLENYIDFLTLFIGEDRNQFEKLKANRSKRIDLLEKGNVDSPYYRFCLAEVNLQWAFARLKFGDYATAALEIRKAYLLFTENEERFPAFLLNKIGLGVVHVMIGIIPDNFKWVARLAGVDGSLEKGFQELQEVAGYNGPDRIVKLYKPETIFFIGVISANLQKDKREALQKIANIKAEPGDELLLKSPLIIYSKVSILMKNGLNDEALHILKDRKADEKAYPFLYLDYLEGLARLNRLDLTAGQYFKRYVQNFSGTNYIKAAIQKMAWIAAINGDTAAYLKTIQSLKDKGAAVVDEDKQAVIEMNGYVFPSIILLRARLLFDGGYYDRALSEMLDNPVKSFIKTRKDLTEYTYRLARIYHETGNIPKALDYYQQTVTRGKDETYYYAASSSYQMGLIYENMGNYPKADNSYRLCISLKNTEYKTSLNQKAKAGLNRLRKMQPKT